MAKPKKEERFEKVVHIESSIAMAWGFLALMFSSGFIFLGPRNFFTGIVAGILLLTFVVCTLEFFSSHNYQVYWRRIK